LAASRPARPLCCARGLVPSFTFSPWFAVPCAGFTAEVGTAASRRLRRPGSSSTAPRSEHNVLLRPSFRTSAILRENRAFAGTARPGTRDRTSSSCVRFRPDCRPITPLPTIRPTRIPVHRADQPQAPLPRSPSDRPRPPCHHSPHYCLQARRLPFAAWDELYCARPTASTGHARRGRQPVNLEQAHVVRAASRRVGARPRSVGRGGRPAIRQVAS